MKMNMVLANMAAQNRDAASLASLTEQVTGSQGHVTFQNMVAILRYPNEMILDVVNGMRTLVVFVAHRTPPEGNHTMENNVLKLFA